MTTSVRASIAIAGLLIISVLLLACGGSDGAGDLFIVVRDGGINDLSLASADETVLIEKPDDSLLIEPALSPDGATIAYVRQLIPIIIPGEPTELGMDLYMADRDGSNQRLVLEHSQPNEQIRAPVWFPDGESMLINVQRIIGGRVLASLEVFVPATGERSVIVEDGFRPALSSDGSRIAYVTQDENILQTLWVSNADGSEPIALAGPDDELGSIISPRFSPDGEMIAFAGSTLPAQTIARSLHERLVTSRQGVLRTERSASAYNGLPADIWTIPVEGGLLRKLAPVQLDLPSLDWSSDGERLYAFSGLGMFVINPIDGESERVGEGTFHGQLDWVGVEAP
jgi:Tol biopolymer transport system component